MILSIERIEDGFAFLESDSRISFCVGQSELPEGAKEGDCLETIEGGGFVINTDEAERRKRRNHDLFNSLLED